MCQVTMRQQCSLPSHRYALTVAEDLVTERRRDGDGSADGSGEAAGRSLGDGGTHGRRLSVAGGSCSESDGVAAGTAVRGWTDGSRWRWWNWWVLVVILVVSALIVSTLVVATLAAVVIVVTSPETSGTSGPVDIVQALLDNFPSAGRQRPEEEPQGPGLRRCNWRRPALTRQHCQHQRNNCNLQYFIQKLVNSNPF